jgi:hypothetical protein
MIDGRGEGIIVATDQAVYKWKIGAEENHSNEQLLKKAI